VKTKCPSCGAPIEFRYDDSFVRICEHCRNAVLRTDRDVESLGKVADLTPIDSPLALFAEGRFGSEGFLLVGMAQINHPAGGIWQEWYAKLDGGKWGWLAEAQGRYYLTFEEQVDTSALPPFAEFHPGRTVELPVHGRAQTFTVAEANTAAYVAATGELPYKLVPAGTFRYVDLDDGQGTFATVDFGAQGDTPAVYVGHQVTLAELAIRGGEAGPAREAVIGSKRLACPNCNAPIELRAPGEAQRVVCESCNTLLALEGAAATVLHKLETKPLPAVPLGSKGTFSEGELTVIGFVRRSVDIDGSWYSFDEYLLHAPAIGFRWLVCSDGNWSYVQPVEVGAVDDQMSYANYDGVRFAAYQRGTLRVDAVLGEFYWKVETGETTIGADYIAPPAMLSRENSNTEVTWSLSSYMTRGAVERAFAPTPVATPSVTDIAGNVPFKYGGAHNYFAFGLAALCAVAIVASANASNHVATAIAFQIPAGAPPAPDATGATPDSAFVVFSDQFQLDGDKNIAIDVDADINNDWAYTACDLVNVDAGSVISFDANLEYYHGYEDGESWTEGKPHMRQFIGPQPSGTYMLRFESQHGGGGTTTVSVKVTQGVFRWRTFAVALLVMGILVCALAGRVFGFEKKRWDNSNVSWHPPPHGVLALIAGAGAITIALIAMIIEAVT
jgi:uncharacterized protein DUF4178